MSIHELQKLYGEPIKEIRGVNTDVAKIIVGDEPPYHSIQVSGELLTVERGPNYTEQTSLKKTSGKETLEAKRVAKDAIETLENEHGSAPIQEVIERLVGNGWGRETVLNAIEDLRKVGDVYEPETDQLRTV